MTVSLGIFSHLILVLLHLAIVVVDLVFLMLLIRFLTTIWPHIALLTTCNRVCSPVLDQVFSFIQKVSNVSYRGMFLVISLALTVVRFFLVAIANSILAA